MDSDDWGEPLNLSIKKKPIAVVAPSSTMILEKIPIRLHRPFDVSDDDAEDNENNDNDDNTSVGSETKKLEENTTDEVICLDLSKNSNRVNNLLQDNNNEILQQQLIQQQQKQLFENFGVFYNNNNNATMTNDKLLKDYFAPFFDTTKNFTTTESIYSMINHLAEQKLLQALYMNSLIVQSNNLAANSSSTSSNGGGGNNTNTTTLLGNYETTSSSTNNNNNNTAAAALNALNSNQKHQYPILNNLLGTSRKLFENSDFYKSKTEALTITVPNNETTQVGGIKKDKSRSHKRSSMDQKNSSSADNKNNQDGNNANDKKKPHIKKPLNAFMLYMKEMRAKVVAECTLKESAAINQILGRRWHALGREEQAKYYELARRERQLHMQLYPDWSSRANASRGKKRKRKQETNEGGNSMKKCRARYGLEHQSQWCKPCRRKKKCIRYMETGDSNDGNHSDDNLGSCGSVGDAQSPPEDDAESINQSLSSPGGLSGLSSLTSPSMILPSPSTSLASPSVSLASPCMSLQSPLTPHDGTYDIKPLILPTTSTLSIPSSHQQSTSNGNGNGNSDVNNYDCKPLNLPTTSSLQITSHLNHHQPSFHNNTPHRNPVGTNPHDINNPLSVNQLTGQCIKNTNSNTNVESSQQNGNNNNNESSRPVISVT